MKQIGISVVIPCYNCENTIERCLDSLKACNYSNSEIILVNDKSTDETDTSIKRYVAKNSNLVSFYANNAENVGAGETRNVGIQYATKEYIVFVDSDDTVDPLFFDKIGMVANKHHSDCIIFNADITDGNHSKALAMFYGGKYIAEQKLNSKLALVYAKGCTCGKAYRTDVVKRNNVRFAKLKRNEDCVFTKIALSFCDSVFYIPDILYHYYDNTNSLMHDASLLEKQNALMAFEQISENLNCRGFSTELHSIYLIEVVYSTTLTCLKKGEDAKMNFKKLTNGYVFKDRYYRGYNAKYRIMITIFRFGLFNIVRRIIS